MSRHKELRGLHSSWQKRLMITVAILVLLAGLYAAASLAAWRTHESQIAQIESDVTKVTEPITKKSDTAMITSSDATRVKEVIEQDYVSCEPTWWYGWQRSLLRKNDMIRRCQTLESTLTTLKENARHLAQFQMAENALAETLKPLAISQKSLTDKQWPEIIATVKEVNQSLDNTSSQPIEYRETYQYAREKVNAIEKAWNKLAAADSTQDKAAYLASLDSLDNAYKGLHGVTERSASAKRALQTKVRDTAQKL